MKENLLSRILSGEASSKEKEAFFLELKDNNAEEELYYEVKSLWLKSSMQQSVIDVDSEFNDLWKKINKKGKQSQLLIRRRILQYAAIALLMIGIGALSGYFISQRPQYTNPGKQTYTAMKGSVSEIEFADGTKVWLNADSKLTYLYDHKNKKRKAELTGEAFFEIVHMDDCPFEVEVGQIIVRDLGTTFNIKAYPENDFIETSLVEGKADILNIKGNTLLSLKPGESAIYFSEEKKIELRSITNNVLSAWRNGKFVIRDQRLEDIFTEISRWYDVEFRFEREELRDYRFTGNIKKSTTALHVLKMLRLTTQFNYRIIENPNQPDVIIIY